MITVTHDLRPWMEAVAELKARYWPYPKASQIAWMREHITPDDWHVLAFDLELIGYVRVADGIIDTLCSIRRGTGTLLMRVANELIKGEGLLSCEPELVPFYERQGWEVTESNRRGQPLLRSPIIMRLGR